MHLLLQLLGLLLRHHIGYVMAEAAHDPTCAASSQPVEADAALVAIHTGNDFGIMRVLASWATRACTLGEVEADLLLGIDAGCWG